jgi:hypothetical protein
MCAISFRGFRKGEQFRSVYSATMSSEYLFYFTRGSAHFHSAYLARACFIPPYLVLEAAAKTASKARHVGDSAHDVAAALAPTGPAAPLFILFALFSSTPSPPSPLSLMSPRNNLQKLIFKMLDPVTGQPTSQRGEEISNWTEL